MAFTGQELEDGQLPTTKGTLYTVPGSTTAYIKYFNIYNTNASQQTILIYVNMSGTSRLWRRIVLDENESADLLDEGEALVLEAGGLVEGVTTTASAVDYFLSGVEEA